MWILSVARVAALLSSFGLVHVLRMSFFSSALRSEPAMRRTTTTTSTTSNRVQVVLAIEALCPDSKRFVQEQLVPTFATLGPHVIQLHVIPFGNAAIDAGNRTVRCQHGLGECDANQYEQCARWIHSSPEQHLPFINCLFYALPMSRHDDAFDTGSFELCAHVTGLSWPRIQACHGNATQSWILTQQAAKETPKHNHVPWVEINGVYMDEDKNVFLEEVCKAYYAGGGKHPACQTKPLTIQIKA